MAYTPTNWQCGDVVTAEKLNKLENGLADCCGGGAESLVFSYTMRPATTDECALGGMVYTYSHSWQELHDAIYAGIPIMMICEEEMGGMTTTLVSECLGVASGDDHGVYIWEARFDEVTPTTLATFYFSDANSKTRIDCGVA